MASNSTRHDEETMETNNSEDFSLPQDTCGLNDPNNLTSDQSNVQSDDVEGPLIGETQKSEGGEADLHKSPSPVNCKKNPSHTKFIPVDKFSLKDLPEGYQDNDVYEWIKASADLTVRVNVEKSSPDRPKFYPKTDKPYPFYNESKGGTGTGMVWDVNKFQDAVWQDGIHGSTYYKKCWCRKCEGSASPSNVWWEFVVFTAAHVVFDGNEANHTTLRLFFDREESPGISVDKVIVDKVSVLDVRIEDDLCELECVTCDETLGNKLMEMFKHYRNVSKKVHDKYSASRSQHKFNFIVSHPHGCSKQVSVGQWEDKLEVGEDRSKLTYTTCTCPGSSGAYVQCLGYDDWIWSDLVHSGSEKP